MAEGRTCPNLVGRLLGDSCYVCGHLVANHHPIPDHPHHFSACAACELVAAGGTGEGEGA